MLVRIVTWVRGLFTKADPEPDLNLPQEWPFKGNAPSKNQVKAFMADLVGIAGTHIIYQPKQEDGTVKRRNIFESEGQTWLVKELLWWLDGKEVPENLGAIGSTPDCAVEGCAAPAHLRAVINQQKKKSKEDKTKASVKAKEQPIKVKKKTEGPPKGDRTRCFSAKLWYPNEGVAHQARRYYNKTKKKTDRKQYVYDCPFCDGFHLTKDNPYKKTKKKRKIVGSW